MANGNTPEYSDEEHLLSEKDQYDVESLSPFRRVGFLASTKLLPASLALNAILLIALVAGWMLSSSRLRYPPLEQIYSPADSVSEYETVVFHSGLHGDITKYQGPSDDVEENWHELYADGGLSQISRECAAKLPNATTPLPFDHSQYVIQLDVFHQLHCLNMMRKLLYPASYPIDLFSGSVEAEDNLYHHEHCVESLRQSLQCSADTGTIFWEWSPANQKMMGNTATTHTCRNFEKLREWAALHKLDQGFDMLVEVEGAPIRKAG